MENEKLLPKPLTDLPLPEKEIPATTTSALGENDGDKKKGSNIFTSKFFLGFMVLSFLIAFLIGGFALGKNQSNKQAPTPTDSPEPTAEAASPNPTANWKTYNYKNASFKYPSDWEVVFNSKVSNQPNGFSIHVQRKGSTGFQPDELNIDTSDVNSNYTLNSARHFTKTDRGDDSFKFEENGTMVYSSCAFYKLGQPTIDICNQILSTFTFNDSASSIDTSTWKTYNSTCGFSVSYPNSWSAKKFFLEDSENACTYITAPDYKMWTDSRDGFYIGVTRTKLGSKGINTIINSLEDYIKDDESIMTPRVSVGEKVNKTYGSLSGISYLPVGFEPGRSFIFIKGDYLYNINWSDKEESNHIAEINEIIKSFKFTQ